MSQNAAPAARGIEMVVYRRGLLLLVLLVSGSMAHATPASPGPDEDATAFSWHSVVDTDADGIEDVVDQCPDSRPSEPIGPNGCLRLRNRLLGTLRFASGGITLRSTLGPIRLAQRFLQRYPHARLIIHGHADSEGSVAVQNELALARARYVRQVLLTHGVSPTLLGVRAHGASQPVASNETAAGRAQNRRVELRVIARDADAGATAAGY